VDKRNPNSIKQKSKNQAPSRLEGQRALAAIEHAVAAAGICCRHRLMRPSTYAFRAEPSARQMAKILVSLTRLGGSVMSLGLISGPGARPPGRPVSLQPTDMFSLRPPVSLQPTAMLTFCPFMGLQPTAMLTLRPLVSLQPTAMWTLHPTVSRKPGHVRRQGGGRGRAMRRLSKFCRGRRRVCRGRRRVCRVGISA
jgi:hypothetical protein